MTPKHRPTHPGEFIKADILQELGMTQTQLATALGISRHTINQLVNQKRGMTLDMALRLGQFTQTSPEMWLNLQLAVDLWDARHSSKAKQIRQIQPFLSLVSS
jgi:addiction module HigA family antidote